MEYDKIFTDDDGDEYPYTASFDEDGYFYRISVIWDDRDGELVVLNDGAHVEFDDDGSWLDFNITPEKVFPGLKKLSDEQLLELLHVLAANKSNSTTYTKDQVMQGYKKYKKLGLDK